MSPLPLLPAMGVGSYASPGWLVAARRLLRDGGLGPADVREAFDDATRVAVADQIDAGVDVVCDGELRRQRFVYEMYDAFEGLERQPPERRLGVAGYDMAPAFRATGPVAAPAGFGLTADYELVRHLVPDRPVKVAIPGPLTFANAVRPVEGEGPDRLLEQLASAVRAELERLVDAGAEYLQVDEPAFPHPPHGLDHAAGAALVNRVLDGLPVRRAVHVCFGNNAGRPFADRRFGRLMDAMGQLRCEQLVLEFANREMAEVELLADLARGYDVAAGVVDVKNWHLESPADVADRIRRCLDHVPAARLAVTADCGFSALPRGLARDKMRAMVDGARIVREEV